MNDSKKIMRLGVRKYIKKVNADNQVITTTIFNSIFEGQNPLKSINQQLSTVEQKVQLTNVFNEREILSSINADPNFSQYIHQYDKWNNLKHTKKVKLNIFFKEVDKEMRIILSAIVEKAFALREIVSLFTLEQVVNIFNQEVSGVS